MYCFYNVKNSLVTKCTTARKGVKGKAPGGCLTGVPYHYSQSVQGGTELHNSKLVSRLGYTRSTQGGVKPSARHLHNQLAPGGTKHSYLQIMTIIHKLPQLSTEPAPSRTRILPSIQSANSGELNLSNHSTETTLSNPRSPPEASSAGTSLSSGAAYAAGSPTWRIY